MVEMSLSRWTPADVIEMRSQIIKYHENKPAIATHLERELWGDTLRFIRRYAHDKLSRDMADEALKTLEIPFKRIMG